MPLLPPKAAPNQTQLVVIPESALKLEKELGSGEFGVVYKVFITLSQTHCHMFSYI